MFWTQPKFYAAMASQAKSLFESAAQVASGGGYGAIPLFVLTASEPNTDRAARQEQLARRSANGRHLIVESSGHWVHLDQPEIVIAAIRDAVDLIRSGPREAVRVVPE